MRFVFVDALRGVASLGVVIFHAVEGHHIDRLPWLVAALAEFGSLGVPVFFVISGFVIAHSLRGQEMTVDGILRFMVKRSVRLDPAYWAAIAIAIGFSILATMMVAGREHPTYSLSQILAHITYTQGILDYRQINPVFWTLCYEIQFYAVFAALLLTGARWVVFAAFAVSLLWCLRIVPNLPGWFPDLWYGFLLGVSARWALQDTKSAVIHIAYAGIVLMAGLVLGDRFAIACALASVLIFTLGRSGQLNVWKPLQFLGVISYSLYLIHNPITGAVFRVGKGLTGDTPATEALWWAVSIAVSILSATALWFIIERPSHALSKRLFAGAPKLKVPIVQHEPA